MIRTSAAKFKLNNSFNTWNSKLLYRNSATLQSQSQTQSQSQSHQPQPQRYSYQQVYESKIDKARIDCVTEIKKFDTSSFLLSKFYPRFLQDSYFAIKAFNIELSKVSLGYQPGASTKSERFNNLKFSFWEEQLDKCADLENDPESPKIFTGEPATTLIADSIRKGINIDLETLRQMVRSHQYYLNNESKKGFDSIDSVCSFGEGTNSQVNYALQSALLSPCLHEFSYFPTKLLELPETNDIRNHLSEISAHLGQATAICSFVIGLKYFVDSKDQLMLPIDILTKNKVSQENILRLIKYGGSENSEDREALKNVVFETCTTANDHVLTARSKLENLKTFIKEKIAVSSNAELQSQHKSLNNGLPDALYLPYMNSLPTVLYLERLQKYDFDILNPKLKFKEWRLAWRSYRSYNGRYI